MQKYAYTAIKSGGQRIEGEIRSRSIPDAVRKLVSRECHPVNLEPQQQGQWSLRAIRENIFGRVKSSELAVFTRQLGILVKTGLPLVEALQTLIHQLKSARLISITEDIRDSLNSEGGSLADAMREHPKVFNRVYVSLIQAGEESGNLVEVLDDLAKYLYQAARLRSHVRGAFIYPAFLFVMGCASVFVLVSFVIPKFQELFDSFGQNLPTITQILINVSVFCQRWWWVFVPVLIALAVLVCVVLRRPRVRLAFDRSKLKIPVFGQMLVKLEMARMSHTLGRLLADDVGMIRALNITGETMSNTAVKAEFRPIAREVATGSAVAEALGRREIFPAMVVNLVRTGEETGELPAMLSELAEIYEDEAQRAVSDAVKLLEPVLIIVIGGLIASIVAAIMLPVFEANTMVQ